MVNCYRYNSQEDYVFHVKQLMKRAYRPRPRLRRPNRKLLDVDGSRIPLIIL